MPNIQSAKKRVKINAKKRLLNRHVKAGIKSNTKKYQAVMATGDQAQIQSQAVLLVSTVDKAAAKGVMHKNKANRIKARIARQQAAAAK